MFLLLRLGLGPSAPQFHRRGTKTLIQVPLPFKPVSFDPRTTKEQRDALAPIVLNTYGLEWGELKVEEAPIEVRQSGDIVEAKLADGREADLKLSRREPGGEGKGVVLKNVKYLNAVQNNGFRLYRSLELRADLEGHQFSYADRNAFLITIFSEASKDHWTQPAL